MVDETVGLWRHLDCSTQCAAGPVDQMRADVAAFAAFGVEHLILVLGETDSTRLIEKAGWVNENVLLPVLGEHSTD